MLKNIIQNFLGSKATTIIGFVLGVLGYMVADGAEIFPEAWLATLGKIVAIGTMLFGGAVKAAAK